MNIGRFGFSIYVFNVVFGLDVMNYWYLYLSHWLFPLYYFMGWFESSFSWLYFIMNVDLIVCFVLLFIFYFLFYYELSIFLIVFIILLKSYSNYRIKSSYLLLLFSSVSSLLYIVVMILCLFIVHSLFLLYLGLLFILSLSIKVPIFPFHH